MLKVISLISPILISGIVLILSLKLKFTPLSKYPLDFNLSFKSKRIFGKNKTLLGLVVFIIFSTVTAFILNFFYRNNGQNLIHEIFSQNPVKVGLLLGFSYEVGELINSFIKRRLNIALGKTKNNLQYFFDLADGPIAASYAAFALLSLSLREAILTASLGTMIHFLTDLAMVKLKLKKIF